MMLRLMLPADGIFTMSSKSPCSKMSHCYPIFFPLLVLMFSVVYCSDNYGLRNYVLLRDGYGTTVISPGKTFELGFFTPDGSLNKTRYLGIWYYLSNPKTVVWVANRDNPLSDSSGFLAVRDGNAQVLDAENKTYWSTNCGGLENKFLFQLNDTGNLIFSRGLSGWQSFDNPTDTFLPSMNSAQRPMTLTCWKNRNNPAPGKFTLQVQQPSLSVQNVGSESLDYWEIPQALSDFFLESSSPLENNSTSRLVMNFTGQVQLWKREAEIGWSLVWSGLKDGCSSYNTCGNYGSCNSNNRRLCKCLPGFAPDAQDKWNRGDFSGGCSPNSDSCKRNFSDDIFLKLPMMKLVRWNYNGSIANQDCETQCRENCDCVAYSCGLADCKERGVLTCWIWRSISLTDLQEEYSEGITIFVRTHPSDISLTSKNCTPCGTNIIPYPLSTAATCGDPSYFSFYCNASTGQVAFSTSKGTFKVTAIIPEKNTFIIEISHASKCDMESLPSPKNSLPFIVTNCSSITQPFANAEESLIEVEMAWKPPLEPACNAPEDCHDWPHTTCKAAGKAKMRCICGSKLRWDGKNLICLRVPFPLKVVITCVSGALAVVLLCGIFFIWHVWKRRLAEKHGSVEFQGDDTGGIDVPFFDWGSIIAATDNFANVNKLGTGGFGTVYKGKLPDGKEVAVKRLSSVTEQGVEEFRTEVVLIAKLQHRNLVRLVGYCVIADERILLYEYMPNGSLDSCLFDQTRSVFLDWEKRFEIIYGIARGLLYLHQDSRLRIIHRDLKPSNILLDEEMNPKISDFGIARIVGGKETEGSTKRVIGTYGYMSPEYAYEGLFSVKSDVFSFGVVVLETISARRNSKLFQFEHGVNLQGYAWKLWNEDRVLDLMDQTLKELCNPSEVLKCIHIGLLCVQEDPTDRPTVSLVVLMLGSENASLPPPKQPAFISRKEPSETASSSSIFESGLHDIITFSTEGR